MVVQIPLLYALNVICINLSFLAINDHYVRLGIDQARHITTRA